MREIVKKEMGREFLNRETEKRLEIEKWGEEVQKDNEYR